MHVNIKQVKFLSYGTAICFLLIHILMINVFYKCGVTPMFRFNIFSIIFYIAILFTIYKGWMRLFASAVYMEVVVHMVLAVIFTGWQGGFQVTLIGMNVLAFSSIKVVFQRLRFKPHSPSFSS